MKITSVRVIGVLTLLAGALYGVAGVAFVGGAVNLANEDSQWQPLTTLLAGIVMVVGVGVILVALLLVLAGSGLLANKRWAKWLAIPLALLLAGIGYLFVSTPDPGPGGMTTGIVHFAYALVTIVTLAAQSSSSPERH